MADKTLKTRVILNHDEWQNYAGKTLRNGEVALIKVGTTQAPGGVTEPIWMMKVGIIMPQDWIMNHPRKGLCRVRNGIFAACNKRMKML